MTLTSQQARTAMLAIGGTVGVAAAVAPDLLLRLFGLPRDALTPAGRLGWRLFAARNIYLTAQALRGDESAANAFGPVQALDQVVFWGAFAKNDLPRPTSLLAIGTSGIIVGLDQVRRRGV